MNTSNILKAEFDSSRQKVLIIASSQTAFTHILTHKLEGCTIHQRASYHPEEDKKIYDVIFFIDYDHIILSEFREYTYKKFIFIFLHNSDIAQTLSTYAYEHKLNQIKIIYLQTFPRYFEKDIHTLLWFSFSPTEDIYLHIYHEKSYSLPKPKKHKVFKLTIKKVLLLGVSFFVLAHILFIPPLIMASYWHYRAAQTITESSQISLRYANQAQSSLRLSQSLYAFSQPIFHFLGIALPVEDMIQLNESAVLVIQSTVRLRQQSIPLYEGLFKTNKSEQEVQEITKSIVYMQNDIAVLSRQLAIIHLKLPEWNEHLTQTKANISTTLEALALAETFIPHMHTILAENTEKKYLLLFANNMELRPGGGFIGSFATVSVRNYTISQPEVFDVYDADGQLKNPTEPPKAIGEILNQPYWFVRDSAFTGDFVHNFKEAEKLLDQEIQTGSFDGGILLTTTAVQELLTAVETLYIPDFQEIITPDNFYIKAQLYAESNFFPGSHQKKSFLSNVMNQLLLKFPQASSADILTAIKRGLNTKQIVLYSTDPSLQLAFEKRYWAGRTLKPTCSIPEALHCIPDYIMPLDANLGVNKANFFVSRPTKLHISVAPSGVITNTATFTYTNNSPEGVFPGGTYKNYFQLMIPPNSQIQSITIDGDSVTEFDETNLDYKTVGFLIEVPIQHTKTVVITYTLPTTIIQGDGVYQLIFQKQIGSENANLTFTFDYPDSISIKRHNLSPLAKDQDIIYNTQISSDKIFLIEFSKQ